MGAIVFHTYQAYLTTTYGHLFEDLHRSLEQDWVLGIKLVRGAYLREERALAEREGRLDVTAADMDTVRDQYRALYELCMAHRERVELMVATHNTEDVLWVLARMEECPTAGVTFAQLLGLGDQLTGALASAGHPVYK